MTKNTNFYLGINGDYTTFNGLHNKFMANLLNSNLEYPKWCYEDAQIDLAYEVTNQNNTIYASIDEYDMGLLYLPNIPFVMQNIIFPEQYINILLNLLNSSENIVICMNDLYDNTKFIELSKETIINLLTEKQRIA